MSNIYKFNDQERIMSSFNNSLPTHIFRPTSFPTYKPITFPPHSFEQFTFPPRHFESYTFRPIKFESPSSNKHFNRSEQSVLVFFIVIIIYVIWEVLKQSFCKKEEEEEDDTEAINFNSNSNSNIQQIPSISMPVASVISETSRNNSLISTSYSIQDGPPTRFIPSVPLADYSQLLVYQPTAPHFSENKVPNYDDPPNYDDAMIMLSQEMQKHRSSTFISTENNTSANQPISNSHESQDTHL